MNWRWAWCKHVCLLACMYIYICNLIAMLMLSVVAPMHFCVCCCLLVSVLSSCVLYAPMHSCICSGSSCVLYVCLLPVCLCFHVWLMIVLVLVLYVCLYLHHPHVQVTPTQQLQQLWELLLQCILACANKKAKAITHGAHSSLLISSACNMWRTCQCSVTAGQCSFCPFGL